MTDPAGLTVGAILERSTRALVEAGVSAPRADALAIASHVLGVDRGGVIARLPDPVPPALARRLGDLIDARARRQPLQQILGRVEFHGLTLAVDAAVLIPRPETEELVDAVLAEPLPERARVADWGTGSGCIAIALAVARPSWSLIAVDVSPAALEVAARNARERGVADRIRLVAADFRVPHATEPLDGIVSNPPYVAEEEWRALAPEVRDHEPKLALVSGPRGDEAYAALLPRAFAGLAPGGLLALELGWTSEAAVRTLAAASGFREIGVRPDLQGIPRILTARR
ncbi:MAG TPA: peptide chain release factor N(5)-glutamine methyltransferase [Candidatus Polarisedimenticolaceae bacterium]|nr:peptide chain release factor N(5)-glutamine methyltransferase [Candidatus Polarisedimenticolaceae bacterium]